MMRPGIETIEGVVVAHLREDVDAANAAPTQKVLAGALDPDASSLVVELGAVRYLDSAGIDMLLRLSNRLDHRRAKLLLVIPAGSRLNRLSEIVGLPDAIEVHPTVASAVEAGRPRTRVASPPPSAPESRVC